MSGSYDILGGSNGTIVHTLMTNLITNSTHLCRKNSDEASSYDYIGFSEKIGATLLEMKKFNHERIYQS
ncbi:MAG: hypothetical protein D3903_12040 [Candidatus Electrothrix sp. GM3_4]|nr:hypothetical protein [Candidatus Electrothrix sp. GM3_4]